MADEDQVPEPATEAASTSTGKAPAKRSAATTSTAKKAAVADAPAKKAPVKKAAVADTPAKKAPAKKAPAKKAPAKKAAATKAPATRATGKRATAKRTARAVARSGHGAVDSAVAGARGSDDPLVLAPKKLSGFDFATWRTATTDPIMRSPMIGLIVLEQPPDWDRLVDRLDRASRIAPVLRQKVIEGPTDISSPRLVVDSDFDLSFHARRYRLPDPGSWDQVLAETRRQSMADFDLARPLWRVTVIEGLQDGGAVLLFKLHHAIADGQGAMMLSATIIDMVPEESDLGPMPPAPVSAPHDTPAILGSALADASSLVRKAAQSAADAAVPIATRALTDPVGAVEDIVTVVKSVSKFLAVPTRPMSPLMTGRSINYHFSTFNVSLSDLKQAAKPHGLSVNDAFMASVTGGLRIYHEQQDEPVAALRCNMPISLRDPNRPAANAVTIARFVVPVDILDPVERMRALHEIVAQWRKEPALHLADPISDIGIRFMPTEVVASAAQKSDFTASNVPGVPIPIYISGARIRAMYPLMSTVGAATNITLLSYNGSAGLGISTDDAAIPDREAFIDCLCQGFEEVIGRPVTAREPFDL